VHVLLYVTKVMMVYVVALVADGDEDILATSALRLGASRDAS